MLTENYTHDILFFTNTEQTETQHNENTLIVLLYNVRSKHYINIQKYVRK